MYPAIHNFDQQVFDNMSEESGKKKNQISFIVKKSLWLVPSQGMFEQAKKKHGSFRH